MLLHLGIPWQENRKGGGLPPPWGRRVGWGLGGAAGAPRRAEGCQPWPSNPLPKSAFPLRPRHGTALPDHILPNAAVMHDGG